MCVYIYMYMYMIIIIVIVIIIVIIIIGTCRRASGQAHAKSKRPSKPMRDTT